MPKKEHNEQFQDGLTQPDDAIHDDLAIDAQAAEDVEEKADDAEDLAGQQMRIRIGNGIKNRRLDVYLTNRYSYFSRTKLQKMIREQGVRINDYPAKPSTKLSPGDIVDFIMPPREFRELIPEDIPLDILYEDDDLMAVNKQVNLIVHPARGYKSGTLVNALVFHHKQLSTGSEDWRPGIVHRLDRYTTGVIIVAKNDTAHWKLSRQFADRTTKKLYLAIVHGTPELDADCIDLPLGVHPAIREKFAIRADIGKQAITYYRVVEKFRGYTLMEVDIRTGRTHQIRVHMSYIKHPVVADDLYGGKMVYPWQIENRDPAPEEPMVSHTTLHAWKLEIQHPTTGKQMQFIAPPPKTMTDFLEALRTHRRLENKKRTAPHTH